MSCFCNNLFGSGLGVRNTSGDEDDDEDYYYVNNNSNSNNNNNNNNNEKSSLRSFKDKPRSGIHSSIIQTIGQTPIIQLHRMIPANKSNVKLYVKLESENPGGSIKDRLAIGVIEWAEKHGQLTPGSGQTVVEASSGNTGIGLAMVCAAKGYPFVCVMAESFSIERRKLMRFYGAKVIVSSIKGALDAFEWNGI